MIDDIDVSVVIPVYNAERFIRTAISSVLSQKYVNIEVIIIDDGSTDSSGKIIQSINDDRIKYFKKENGGIVSALNFAIPKVHANIIARMDADDIMEPLRLRKQLDYMARNNLDVVGGNIKLIDENGRIIGRKKFPTNHFDIISSLPFINPLCHPATMIRTDVLKKANGYSLGTDGAEDFDLWCRLSRVCTFGSVPEDLLSYRLTSNSISQTLHLHRISLCTNSIRKNIPNAPIVFYSFSSYLSKSPTVLIYVAKYAYVTKFKSFYYMISGFIRALNFSFKIHKEKK
ncbi:glycosyltransferase [Yersinia enterocolitica]|uniref:glycosyltransferase n=1 Tax=Yersinia enterocolitica TaxID=630 RepID=UPI003F4202E2